MHKHNHKVILCRFPTLLFSCLSLNATCNEQLCKEFFLLPGWRSPQCAPALQREHHTAYIHSATEVKLSERDKVGSGLSLLSAYCGNLDPSTLEEKTHHTGSDQRAVLAKCLPACNKCLHEKHKKKRENTEILFP